MQFQELIQRDVTFRVFLPMVTSCSPFSQGHKQDIDLKRTQLRMFPITIRILQAAPSAAPALLDTSNPSSVSTIFVLSGTFYQQNPRVCYFLAFHSSSDQTRSVPQSCPTLCNPMNRSTPGLPVHHQLLEFTETHVHRVSDAIQSSHPLSSPSPLAPNPSQHQSLFQ